MAQIGAHGSPRTRRDCEPYRADDAANRIDGRTRQAARGQRERFERRDEQSGANVVDQ